MIKEDDMSEFFELKGGIFINLSMIVELDKEQGTVELANGVIWHLTDDTITEIIKRITL
jgi:hypothetical protein